MKVLFPERILDRHVGGNTTYGRFIEAGLKDRGVVTGRIPAGSGPVGTVARETRAALARRRDPAELLHYVADTGPLLRTRRPSVVTVHGVASRWISTARTPRQERTWRGRVSRAIASCDSVITVSHSSAADVADVFGIDPALITVIHHGVEVARPEAGELSAAVRDRIPSEFLLYLGNIEPRKNLVPLIEAVESSEVRSLGLPLVLAGKPAWNAESSMAAISRATNVVPLGFVSDADRYHLMRLASAFVFPSLYEGFGFPVLEAMSLGTPVITSDRGSLAEVAGPAFRLEDVGREGITDGIIRALGDRSWLDSMAEAGPAWASQFTWQSSVERHLGVYRATLEAAR